MLEPSDDQPGLSDFDRIVTCLNKHEVEFMIVGGIAVVYHGYVRDTKDLDFFIRRTEENSKRAVAALEEAGWGCPELKQDVFSVGNGISLGSPPQQADVLSSLPGVSFDDAWPRSEISFFGPNKVHYIGLDDLITNKRQVGRPQDIADLVKLELERERRKNQGKDM